MIDEISGRTGFLTPGDRNTYSWPGQTGATRYEVLRSNSAAFIGSCWNYSTPELHWRDPAIPVANGVYFYLVRLLERYAGSLGTNQAGTERTRGGCSTF